MAQILDTSKQVGRYYLNDKDMFSTYGIVFGEKAYAALLQVPQTKDDYVQVFADEDGSSRPDDVYYQTMTYNLPFVIMGTSPTDILTKYNNFVAELMRISYHYLEVPRLNARYKLRYTNMTDFDTAQKIVDGTQMLFTFTIQFYNDFPTQNSLFRKAMDAATAQGYTVDPQTFDNAVASLGYSYQKEAAVVLAPGIYKSGNIAGVDTNGNIIPFTFARAGSATYIDKNGVMQTAAANMPRIDYSDGTAKYLIENASINLCPYSTDLTHWNSTLVSVSVSGISTKYGRAFYRMGKNSTAPAAAATLACGTSAANTTYYYRITLRAGSVSSCAIGIGLTPDPADSSGGSLWGVAGDTMKIISGPGAIAQHTVGNAIADITGLSQSTDTVVVISRTYISANIAITPAIYPDTTSSTNANAYILASTVQLEANGYSSQIDTNGASVTRVADALSSTTDIIPYQAASMYADFTFKYQGAPNVFVFGSKNSLELRYFMSSNGTSIVFYDASNSSGTNIVNNKYIALYDSAGKKIANGGIVSASSSTSAHVPSYGNFTFNTGAGGIAINLRSMVIFSRKLASTEAVTLTSN